MPVYRSFSPDDVPAAEIIRMTVDEYEALRLLDDEGLTQEACAAQMNIARTTVTAIYDSARKKIADALVHIFVVFWNPHRCSAIWRRIFEVSQ